MRLLSRRHVMCLFGILISVLVSQASLGLNYFLLLPSIGRSSWFEGTLTHSKMGEHLHTHTKPHAHSLEIPQLRNRTELSSPRLSSDLPNSEIGKYSRTHTQTLRNSSTLSSPNLSSASICEAIGGCEFPCAEHATTEPLVNWSSMISARTMFHRHVWEVTNVCSYDSGAMFYFSRNDWTFKVKIDTGKSSLLPLVRYNPIKHHPLPTTVKWTNELAVLHSIPKHYYQNIGHTIDYLTAQINALGWYPGVNLTTALDTEWVFFLTSLQRKGMFDESVINFYKEFVPLVAPKCRTVLEMGSIPSNNPSNGHQPIVRCFRRAVVGLSEFDIQRRPQNFTLLRSLLERWDTECPPLSNPTKLLVIYRKHPYRSIKNIENVTAILARTLQFAPENVQQADFAKMTLKEQACAARNAKVMFGVVGAALTWAMALQPGALLLQVLPERLYGLRPWYINVAKSAKAHAITYVAGGDEIRSQKFDTMELQVSRLEHCLKVLFHCLKQRHHRSRCLEECDKPQSLCLWRIQSPLPPTHSAGRSSQS